MTTHTHTDTYRHTDGHSDKHSINRHKQTLILQCSISTQSGGRGGAASSQEAKNKVPLALANLIRYSAKDERERAVIHITCCIVQHTTSPAGVSGQQVVPPASHRIVSLVLMNDLSLHIHCSRHVNDFRLQLHLQDSTC